MHDSAKLWFGNETFDTYLSQPRITSTTSDRPRADVLELEHIVQITAVDGVMCEKLKHADKNLFDANWVFSAYSHTICD